MLSFTQLLSRLDSHGARLRADDGRLAVQWPSGTQPPADEALREALTYHRDRLMAMLRDQAMPSGPNIEAQADPLQRYEPFALTDVQHAYWIGRRGLVDAGGVSTHLYMELDCTGLELPRLEAALARLIERHDMLRAVILPNGLQQVLQDVPAYRIAVDDLSHASTAAREAALQHTRDRMSHQVLPTEQWPLFEFRASRTEADGLRLHCSLDMLILDASSLFRLFGEWKRFYDDPGFAPPPLGFQFRDHVAAEQALRQKDRYARDERYWLDRLDSLPAAPALPLAPPSAEATPTRFTRRSGGLPAASWAALKQRGRGLGITPSALLAAAYAEVLRLWAQEPDFTLNLTLFNRPPVHPDVAELMGDFTAISLLEVRDAANSAFATRAGQVQRQLAGDLEHLQYNGVRVLREMARGHGSGLPRASMPVVFTSALAISGGYGADALHALGRPVWAISQTPQVHLDNQVAEDGGALVIHWDAAQAAFPSGLVDDMFDSYLALLQRLSEDDDAWLGHARPAQLPARQRGLWATLNDTGSDPAERMLHEAVAARALAEPAAPAVFDAAGCCTHAELARHAARLAHWLQGQGLQPNQLVAITMDKGWQQVAAALGVLQSGAAYLPIEHDQPDQRRHRMLALGDTRLVLTQAHLRHLSWPEGTTVVTLEELPAPDHGTEAPPACPATPRDLAYVLFTSGSTGEPKGVMIEHRAAANTVHDINRRFAVGRRDRVLSLSALGFDLSVYDMFGVLGAGGAVVMPDHAGRFDPRHWSSLLDTHAVTLWNSVPQLLQLWLDRADHASGPPGATLRQVLLSGDRIPLGLPPQLAARCPQAAVSSLGGATEAGIWSIHHLIDVADPGAGGDRIPYGRPLAGQRVRVVDAALQPRPVWAIGEIGIAGAGLARGYWRNDELTAKHFVAEPRSGERWYLTGDLGRLLPDGSIDILGRNDSQVKLNGHRVELDEVAAHLRRQPGVGEALVQAAAHPLTGQRQLVAYLVPATAADVRAAPVSDARWNMLLGAGSQALSAAHERRAGSLSRFGVLWQQLEEASPLVMARALVRLGAFPTSPGGAVPPAQTVEAITTRCGIPATRRSVLSAWMSVLADAGLVQIEPGPAYRPGAALSADAIDTRCNDVLANLRLAEEDRAWQPLLDYFCAQADQLPQVLTNQADALSLLFPGGESLVADVLYQHNPVNQALNEAAAALLRSVVEQHPPQQPLRLLEVGAGTGATTAALLPVLPPGRAHYHFTDISPFFLARARDRFASHAFVEYGLLDIDREPVSQGHAAASVDVLIAVNVLHDAQDIDQTLRQLRTLLAPGGLLLLIEGTRNGAVQLATVALLESFGSLRDRRRDSGLPLMSPQQWARCLHDAGFARTEALPLNEGPGALPQHLMLAQVPHAAALPAAATLEQTLRSHLPAHMVPVRYVQLDSLPLSRNGKLDLKALPSPWTSADAQARAPVPERALPCNDTERALVEIWQEAFDISAPGVADGFLDLGGDSLIAVHIVHVLQQRFPALQSIHDTLLEKLLRNASISAIAQLVLDAADTNAGQREVHLV